MLTCSCIGLPSETLQVELPCHGLGLNFDWTHCLPLVAAFAGIVTCAHHLLSLIDHVLEGDPFKNSPRLASQS